MNASEILDQLCYINQIFAPDFKFYLADGGFDYTFNDSYYDLKNTATFDDLIKNANKKVVNVYLVKTFKLDGQVGFSDAIYAPTQDVILVQYPFFKSEF